MVKVCLCCGHRARTHGLCAVCAWDDRDIRWHEGKREHLLAAQRNYAQTGACDPELVDLARPARADEPRAPWWHPLDDAPAILCALFEVAFADVELDGGVSLEEAELIDEYALPSRNENTPPPPGYGHGPRWQDLPRAAIDRFPWGNFTFQDARGIRYHIPAFVCAHLRGPDVDGMESLLFVLDKGHQLDAVERILTPEQRTALARYLAFGHLHPDRHGGSSGLRKRWGKYLDPEHLAALDMHRRPVV